MANSNMQPKRISEYTPITNPDGNEVLLFAKNAATNGTILIKNLPISMTTQAALDLKTNDASLAAVAKSGSYNDLSNKPTIPTVPVVSVNGKTGAVVVTATDVNLGNASNTSDANKPVSTAQQTALDAKINAINSVSNQTASFTAAAGIKYNVDATSGNLIATLPATNNKRDVIIISKSDSTINTVTVLGTINGTAATSLPLRTAIQGKLLQGDGTGNWNVIAGDLNLAALDARYALTGVAIPESQVTNLVSDLAAKAPLASPALTGTPTAPTATAGNNTAQLATTAFIQSAIANLVASAPTTLDTLNEIAAALGNDPNFAATITTSLGNRVQIGGDLGGTPTAPTVTFANDTLHVLRAGDSMTGQLTITRSTTGDSLRIDSSTSSGVALRVNSGTGVGNIFDSNSTTVAGTLIRNQTAVRTGTGTNALFVVQNSETTGSGSLVYMNQKNASTLLDLQHDNVSFLINAQRILVNKSQTTNTEILRAVSAATINDGGDYNFTGSVSSFTASTPTLTSAGVVTDSRVVMQIRNQNAAGTGNVLRVENSGTGYTISGTGGSWQLSGGNLLIDTARQIQLQGTTSTAWLIGRNILSPATQSIATNRMQFMTTTNSGEGYQFLGNSNVPLLEIGNPAGITGLNAVFSVNAVPLASAAYSLGNSTLYWLQTYSSRYYVNATAYIDGATSGVLQFTGQPSAGSWQTANSAYGSGSIVLNSNGYATSARSSYFTMGGKDAADNGGVRWTWYADADNNVVGTMKYSLYGYPLKNTDGTAYGFEEFINFTFPTSDGISTYTKAIKLNAVTNVGAALSSSTYTPNATATYDIGSTTLYWRAMFGTRYNFSSTAYIDGGNSGNMLYTGNLGSGTAVLPVQAFTLGNGKNFAIEMGTPGIITATAGVAGALADGTYYLKLVGVDATGVTIAGPESSVVITGAAGAGSAALSWTAMLGVSGYRVYIGTTPGGENVYFSTTTPTFALTTLTGATGGTTSANTNAYNVLLRGTGNSYITGGNLSVRTSNNLYELEVGTTGSNRGIRITSTDQASLFLQGSSGTTQIGGGDGGQSLYIAPSGTGKTGASGVGPVVHYMSASALTFIAKSATSAFPNSEAANLTFRNRVWNGTGSQDFDGTIRWITDTTGTATPTGHFSFNASSVEYAAISNTGLITSRGIVPQTNASYDVGSTALYYNNIYSTKNYFNATAYLDGSTAGQATMTGMLVVASSTATNQFQLGVSTNAWQINRDNVTTGDLTFRDTANGERVRFTRAGVVNITNVVTAPTANATAGGYLYVEAGALKYRGSGGTVTVLGLA